MGPTKRLLVSTTFVAFLLPPSGYSQAPAETPAAGDPAPAPPTLAERMQRSVMRQVESAARMQASVERQRAAVQRQSGQPASDGSFFALPGPSHIPLTLTPPPAEEAVPDGEPAPDGSAPPEDKEEKKDDIPPPGLIPFDPSILPKAIAPIEGVRPISGISPIPGTRPGSVSTATAQQLLQGMMAPGSSPRPVGGSYLEELLRGLGRQGSAPPADLQHPQSDAGGDYSGRDSAPVTSFSLVNWLLGL